VLCTIAAARLVSLLMPINILKHCWVDVRTPDPVSGDSMSMWCSSYWLRVDIIAGTKWPKRVMNAGLMKTNDTRPHGQIGNTAAKDAGVSWIARDAPDMVNTF
jgi:hypothetical protein